MSAKILSFTPRERSAESRSRSVPLMGTIVIFTGVRYERLPSGGDVPQPTKSAKRRTRRAAPAR